MRRALLTVAAALAISATPASATDTLDLIAVAVETDRLCEASFREMSARGRRLIEVSTRVRLAAVDLCRGKVAPVLGLQVTSTRDLPAAFLTPAVRTVLRGEGAYVVSVLDDSAAKRAGILAGDRIVSIDGHLVETDWEVHTRRARAGSSSLRFSLERNGQSLEHDVPYEPGCYYQPFLALSSSWNAFANRRDNSIVVYSELVRAAETDDELAMVIGHELGHIVLAHDGSKVSAEADADYFGAYAAARAGYDPAAGSRLWAELARTKVGSLISYGTHPTAPERTLALAQAVEEIRVKRAEGSALEPQGMR